MNKQLSQPSRSHKILRVLLAVIFVIAGAFLVLRPLTSLLVLFCAIAALPIICGAYFSLRVLRERRVVVRALVGVVGAALSIFLFLNVQEIATYFAYALAISLALVSVSALFQSQSSARPLRRTVAVLWVLAAIAGGIVCWLWPDLASIAAGFVFSLALIVAGVVIAVRVLINRKAREVKVRKPSTPITVLRVAGAGLATVAAAVLAVGSIVVQAPTFRSDGFYTYNGELPKQPGTLLKVGAYNGETPAGAKAVRILYSSTYSDGTPALVSAVVAFPSTTATTPRTVLAWQHGTTGIAQSCGPSLLNDALSEVAIPGIGRAIKNDWVVVATDYPGQATSGRYPYLIGEGEGRATLDGIRAAKQLEDASASDNVLLWGHSQGGHATLWAGQISSEYAPELLVRGVAALSSATDPLTEAKAVTSAGPVGLVVTPYLLLPYATEYDDIDPADIVHPAGHGIVNAMGARCAFDKTMLASVVSVLAVSKDVPLFSLDFDKGPVRDRLAQNIATGIVPAPLFLGQGVNDEVVPIRIQRSLAASLEAAGRDVEVHEYEGRSHMGVIAADSPLLPDLFAWAEKLELK